MARTETTINICPRWQDIIGMMLTAWKEGDLSREQRNDLEGEFLRIAKCADEVMKQNKQGPFAKGGRYYEDGTQER